MPLQGACYLLLVRGSTQEIDRFTIMRQDARSQLATAVAEAETGLKAELVLVSVRDKTAGDRARLQVLKDRMNTERTDCTAQVWPTTFGMYWLLGAFFRRVQPACQ